MNIPATKKLCERCRQRKARYWSQLKSKMQWRPDHELCQECAAKLRLRKSERNK